MSQFDAGQGALLQAVTQGPRLLPPTAQLSWFSGYWHYSASGQEEKSDGLCIPFLNTSTQKWHTSLLLTFLEMLKFEACSSLWEGSTNLWESASHLCHKGAINKISVNMYGPGFLCCWQVDKNHVVYVTGIWVWRPQGKQKPNPAAEAPEMVGGDSKNTRHNYSVRQGGW